MAKAKSSSRWLKEHFDDPYVKKAQAEGYRSRAVYKLEELQKKYRIIKPGMTVIDLGAAPGAWSQYAAKGVGAKGRVLALDLLMMDALDGVEFIQGDFRDEAILNQLMESVGDSRVDLVISDMAPNISGISSVDQPRAMYLAELALDLAQQVLPKGSGFITKVFQGAGSDEYLRALKKAFQKVQVRKPDASRPRSPEVYAVATGRK